MRTLVTEGVAGQRTKPLPPLTRSPSPKRRKRLGEARGLSFDAARVCNALDQVFLAVQKQQQGRDHVYRGHGEGKANLAGVDPERKTLRGWASESCKRISGCSTMFQ